MRRVVTGHDAAGKSVFVFDDEPSLQATHSATGAQLTEVWGTVEVPSVPDSGDDPTIVEHQYFPAPGGTAFVVVRFAPAARGEQAAASGVDVEAATKEFYGHFRGLGDLMEPDHPGMHTSQTVDYIVILSGEIDLELDYGETRRLKAGDLIVQNGTRHAWRNPGDVDCVAVAVLVGARSAG